jgi:hypothetical protein
MAASSMWKLVIGNVNKELHVRPVIWASIILSTIGFGAMTDRMIRGPEHNMYSYIKQNEINPRSLMERELNSEFFLLFSTPPESIPVPKRHVWQMANECEAVYDKINLLPPISHRTDEQQEEFQGLYSQWLSQIYDVYWTLAEQRGLYTPEQRRYNQTRQYVVQGLPPAAPFKIRPFPQKTQFINPEIQPPAENAPRDEFVKYYALKYNVDL